MDCKEQNLIETVHYHCTSAEPRKCMLGLTSRGSAAQNSFNAGDVGWHAGLRSRPHRYRLSQNTWKRHPCSVPLTNNAVIDCEASEFRQ